MLSLSRFFFSFLFLFLSFFPVDLFAYSVKREFLSLDNLKEVKFTEKEKKEIDDFFQKVEEIIRMIKLKSIKDKLNMQDILDQALKKMVAEGVDKYSTFMNQEEFDEMSALYKGGKIGIGIMYGREEVLGSYVEILAIIEESPAQRAGLKPGDRIYKVDDLLVEDMKNFEKFSSVLKGKKGEKVRLYINRKTKKSSLGEADYEEKFFVIERDVFNLKNVSYKIIGENVGYIFFKIFDSSVIPDLKKAIKELDSSSPKGKLDGLIIDLRFNGGGLVNVAFKLVENLLSSSEEVAVIRDAFSKTIVSVKGKDVFHGRPIIILTSKNTASAAELISVILREKGRAYIIGTKTLGKGIIQGFSPLKTKGYLKMTLSQWYTSSGQNIHSVGIYPDIYSPFSYHKSWVPGQGKNFLGDAQLALAISAIKFLKDWGVFSAGCSVLTYNKTDGFVIHDEEDKDASCFKKKTFKVKSYEYYELKKKDYKEF